jgi:hypothetical protein
MPAIHAGMTKSAYSFVAVSKSNTSWDFCFSQEDAFSYTKDAGIMWGHTKTKHR